MCCRGLRKNAFGGLAYDSGTAIFDALKN